MPLAESVTGGVTNKADGTVTTLLNGTVFPSRKIVPVAGAPLAATPPVTDSASGTATRSFVDGYGNTVTDTLDQGGRLLNETVADTLSGTVYTTNTLTYMPDGSFVQNVTQATTSGSLSTAIAYGPQGQLTETLKDPSGAVTGTATVTYGADGTISRHQTTVGKPGYEDLVFNNGAFVSSTSNDAAGTITSRDSSGNVIASTLDNGDGTSTRYTLNPSAVVAKTITHFAALGGTGSVLSDVIDNVDQTSLLYTYNPTATVKQTTSKYTGTDGSNGAPSGAQISDVVDNTDGTSLVYAYNPTSTVTQTAQAWSSTNASNGAPAGSEISDVVDNTDGTSLVYAYNPSSTVTQTAQRWSGTNPANGAPAGTVISDVVDNTNGTSIVYAYNPTSTVTQTATFYSGTDATTGAPTGTVTSETFDYTTGASSIANFNADGSTTTTQYSGADGTGTVGTTTVDLSGISNTASVTGGLPLPNPTITGMPYTLALGAAAETVSDKLTPSMGIVELSNFQYGLDQLNIDLNGAANSVFQAVNTTLGGTSAIALYSNADPTHGIILTNVGSTMTADNLLASHLTFSGGHALVT